MIHEDKFVKVDKESFRMDICKHYGEVEYNNISIPENFLIIISLNVRMSCFFFELLDNICAVCFVI